MSKLRENCPICGKKMEKGYLIDNTAIRWSRIKRHGSALGAEIVAGKRYPWTLNNIEAYMCRDCKIVLFYGDKIQPRSKTSKTPEELYERLLHMYASIGGKQAIEHEIESYVKEGYSREETILYLAWREKLL